VQEESWEAREQGLQQQQQGDAVARLCLQNYRQQQPRQDQLQQQWQEVQEEF